MEAKELTNNFVIEKSGRTFSKSRTWCFERFRYFENWVIVTTDDVQSGTQICVCVVPKIFICLGCDNPINSAYNYKKHNLNEQVYSKAKSDVVILQTLALCLAVTTVPVGKLYILAQQS